MLYGFDFYYLIHVTFLLLIISDVFSSFTSYPYTLFLYLCNLVILIVVVRSGMLYGFCFCYLIQFFLYLFPTPFRRLLLIPYTASLPTQFCNFNSCWENCAVTAEVTITPWVKISTANRVPTTSFFP